MTRPGLLDKFYSTSTNTPTSTKTQTSTNTPTSTNTLETPQSTPHKIPIIPHAQRPPTQPPPAPPFPQAEEAVKSQGFEAVGIFRPGLLDRGAKARSAEITFNRLVSSIAVADVAKVGAVHASVPFEGLATQGRLSNQLPCGGARLCLLRGWGLFPLEAGHRGTFGPVCSGAWAHVLLIEPPIA